MRKPKLWETIWRSSRLKCPSCGQGEVAKNWRETWHECARCGFDFRVEGGFYLGTVYFNYGLSALLVLGVSIPLVWFGYLSPIAATIIGGLVGSVLSVWFWRYARSLWLGFGYYIDHTVRAGQKETRSVADRKALQQTYVLPGEVSLDGVCYFCQQRFQFAESLQNTWLACPFCREKILLAGRTETAPSIRPGEENRPMNSRASSDPGHFLEAEGGDDVLGY